MNSGRLYLIPVPLGEDSMHLVLPLNAINIAQSLRFFIVENAKTARAFLKTLPTHLPLQELQMRELNEHSKANELDLLLSPLLAGNDVGLLSEAGCPAVADPGAQLVALCHQNNILVTPLIGPSSILLALMGSGLSGQNFAFHGYLPVKANAREAKIRALEKEAQKEARTQIFIETPYRNLALFSALLAVLAPQTQLCLAVNLTQKNEQICTKTCASWQKVAPEKMPAIDKNPTVFLLQA